ncbi:MAG: WD40 repeat domain-containing protein [Chlamydiae bacterium]|nr:WD40 repeat domain-containing protein [Chlamydiota bacterium]
MASSSIGDGSSSPLLYKATKVHSDDIHAICKVSSGSFISGSKDTSVKQFTHDGRLIKVISDYPHGYAYWITALDLFSDRSWVSGQRNGYLKCADLSGRVYVGNKLQSPARESGKERNDNRICSLKCQGLYKVLIGQSGRFSQYDCATRTTVRSYEAESPDWFYGFCPIDPERVLAIHSTSLSLFQAREHDFALIDPLIRYDEELRLPQKPFISSILPMKDDTVRQVALSFFGGEVQVFDIEAKTPVFRGLEHTKRVWQATPYTTNNFLSCADDGTIKVWDARESASIHTIGGHPGRVSALCFLEETVFVAGTCSDAVDRDPNKGQFFFYDLRKL